MATKRSELEDAMHEGTLANTALRVRIGYNHDVTYRGSVFHIQTEDSGKSKGRVNTHIFHGGTIIASNRVGYEQGMSTNSVVALLQKSHKDMVRKLACGQLDREIERLVRGAPDPKPILTVAASEPAPASPLGIEPAANIGTPAHEGSTPTQPPIETLDPDELTCELEQIYRAVSGAIGVALASCESGLSLGLHGPDAGFDIEVAAAGNMDVMRAKRAVMDALGIEDGIEDILITLHTQYHLIRPVGTAHFVYLAIDRARGNLMLGRLKLAELAARLLSRMEQPGERA